METPRSELGCCGYDELAEKPSTTRPVQFQAVRVINVERKQDGPGVTRRISSMGSAHRAGGWSPAPGPGQRLGQVRFARPEYHIAQAPPSPAPVPEKRAEPTVVLLLGALGGGAAAFLGTVALAAIRKKPAVSFRMPDAVAAGAFGGLVAAGVAWHMIGPK